MFREIDYDKHILIGTPLVGWKVQKNEHNQWISDIASIQSKFKNAKFFAALEVDARGISEYGNFIDELKNLGIDFWTYSINDDENIVTSQNRWIRIETGRNLIREFAQRFRVTSGHHWGEDCTEQNIGVVNYEAILYVDSDISLNADIVEKLLEVDRPLVGVNVPEYGLSGKSVSIDPPYKNIGQLLVCF